jgi:Nif-specific regulatory protein
MRTEPAVPNAAARPDKPPAPLSDTSPEYLSLVAYAGQEIAAGATMADGFERAMRFLDARFSAKRAALTIANPIEKSLGVEAAYGAPVDSFRPRYAQGVAGRVADGGRPIVVPAVRQEPMALSELAHPAEWREHHFSLVAVPVCVSGQCAGTLSVYFEQDAPTDFSVRLSVLQVVASLLGQGLRTARFPAGGEVRDQRGAFEYSNMIGTSPGMREVYEQIGQVARTTATALILGESGTGKELVAQAIHNNSERARQPFITINAAAFPETLFESELFGHERGAFTGATARKKGRFELAQGGTLFLDEIGELPLSTQVKLLRVLQFREFERLGGTETVKSDVRLIAATNKRMEVAVANGTFREDLFYRLNVFTITLPPLRERGSDVPALAEYFLEKYANLHHRAVRRIASNALDALARYSWPGNVRELENVIERAVVVCDGAAVEARHLPPALRADAAPSTDGKMSLASAVEKLERHMIGEALRQTGGNLARAARALDTTERILRYKVTKYGLDSLRSK